MEELFIESICLKEGKPQLLPYHTARMARTAKELGFPCPELPDLSVLCPEPLRNEVVKCRILYRGAIEHIGFDAYRYRTIRSFEPVQLPDGYTYRHKSTDRTVLNELKSRSKADEVLLVNSEGFLTDSSFSNLALLRQGHWYTPDTPLLEGVQRAFLIDQGILTPTRIQATELERYEEVRFINAMRPLTNGR